MRVMVNGAPQELVPGSTVADLVASVPGAPEGRGLAVALDGEVVPRGRWASAPLSEGAQIEIVVAVQGG